MNRRCKAFCFDIGMHTQVAASFVTCDCQVNSLGIFPSWLEVSMTALHNGSENSESLWTIWQSPVFVCAFLAREPEVPKRKQP